MARSVSVAIVVVLFLMSPADAALLPNGVLNDEQTSIVYFPDSGEVRVDVPPGVEVGGMNIESTSEILLLEQACSVLEELGIRLLNDGFHPCPGDGEDPFKPPTWPRFGSISFGNLAQPGLAQHFLLGDLTVVGALAGGATLGPVDLVYMHELLPGDADRDFAFDQLDIVQVLQTGKYLTGQSATWGEGDWNGGPGGYPGEPPVGDSVFDQLDVVAALQTGAYLSGAYAAIRHGGIRGDEQTSIVYDARTGEIAVDVPASRHLTSINIDSAAGIFTGGRSKPGRRFF